MLPRVLVKFSLLMGIAIISFSCNNEVTKDVTKSEPITKREVIAFQKSYGVSFNSISEAIDNETYYETKANQHIDKFYNFDDSEVMIKVDGNIDTPFRYTKEGLLSYLIGKSSKFPNDKGITKQNWRKIDWSNNGIIYQEDMAIIFGKVDMSNEDQKTLVQNFMMALKRNADGELKLIAHKISKPCE
jgi:hypothetical protein